MQFFRTESEANGFCLSRGKSYALKTFQLADWTRSTAGLLMNIELDDFIAGATARIFDINGNFDSISYFDFRLIHLEISKGKGRIA